MKDATAIYTIYMNMELVYYQRGSQQKREAKEFKEGGRLQESALEYPDRTRETATGARRSEDLHIHRTYGSHFVSFGVTDNASSAQVSSSHQKPFLK